MEFSIAFIQNDERIAVREFSEMEQEGPSSAKLISFEDLSDSRPSLLLLGESLSDETMSTLSEENRFAPIISAKQVEISFEQFEKLNFHEALHFLSDSMGQWSLHHNINLIDNLFCTLEHLKGLLHNDRTTFFEELWNVLKLNLGFLDLTVLYNDLNIIDEEKDKKELIVAKISGNRLPESTVGKEIDQKLMDHYKDSYPSLFEVVDYNPEKQELVALASINKSPILMMGHTAALTKIQTSLIKTLFEGVSK